MSFLKMEEKSVKSKKLKKLPNKCKKEFEEFDDICSLTFLKDVKEKKKLKGIDETIKLLKTKLKSLLDNEKACRDCDQSADNKNDLVCTNFLNQRTSGILQSTQIKSSEYCSKSLENGKDNTKSNISSIPSKFSDWLDKTIDEMDLKSQTEKRQLPNTSNESLSSKLQMVLTKTSPSFASDFKFSFTDKHSLSQEEVEKLLYKSFVMQSFEVYLSSSEESGSEHIKSTKEKQQKYRRSRKWSKKSHKEKLIQDNLNKYSKVLQKGRKRRLINRKCSLSNVEIIDVENNISNNEMTKTNCEVLDVDKYDWNEPFDLYEDVAFHSDVEILDTFKKNNEKLNSQDVKSGSNNVLKSDQSICYNERSKTKENRVWECPVCFEQSKGQEVVATHCGHVFCKTCIENHILRLGKNCPSCRSDLRNKSLITLFNF